MYPGCEKVDPKVTAKTTLECISDLIQSERDLSRNLSLKLGLVNKGGFFTFEKYSKLLIFEYKSNQIFIKPIL